MKIPFIFSLIFTIVLNFHITFSQIVNFKAETFYSNSDLWNGRYGLKLDSVEIYNYQFNKNFIIYSFDNIELNKLTDVFNEKEKPEPLKINKINIDNSNLLIDYSSENQSAIKLNIIDVVGNTCISKSFYDINKMNEISFDLSGIANGIYILTLEKNSKIITYPFIYCRSISMIKQPLVNKIVSDNNLYSFTGFAKNRKAVIIDSIIPNNNDTIKFLFYPETPYNFRNIRIELNIPDSRINTFTYQSNQGTNDTSNGLILKQEFVIPYLERGNNKDYYLGFDEAASYISSPGMESETINGAFVKFQISGNYLLSLYIHSCVRKKDGMSTGYENLYLSLSTLKYNIVDDNLIIDLNASIISSLIENISYKGTFAWWNSSRYSNWNLDKIYSYNNAIIKIFLKIY